MLKIFMVFMFSLSSLEALENSPLKSTVNWEEYFKNTFDETEPRITNLLALQYFQIEEQAPGYAVDLGTGTGRDALFLLKKGWDVLALDSEALSREILLNRAHDEQLDHLDVVTCNFSEMILPDNIDFINASFSLPFCLPEEFSDCWEKITDHLTIGGRFAGQLFGDRDEWASDPSKTFHTLEEMLELFEEHFAIEYLQIEEGLLPTAAGPMKHWHVYHIVAKKIQ